MVLKVFLGLCVLGLCALGLLAYATPGSICLGCATTGTSRLEWRTGLTLHAPQMPEFGGISGLSIPPDGTSAIFLGDRAVLLHAMLSRNFSNNHLKSVTLQQSTKMLNPTGLPLTLFNSDAEALSRAAPTEDQSRLFVGFEGLARIISYPMPQTGGGEASAARLHTWNRFENRFGNVGFEALAPLPGGGLLAIAEAPLPNVDTGIGPPAFTYRNGVWSHVFDIPDPDGFSVSGADLGPQGDLWLLERRVGWTGFMTRIRHFAVLEQSGKITLGPAQTVLKGNIGLRDNYEAIGLWCTPAGTTAVMIVSDDGFSMWQRTALAEFSMVSNPPRPCTPPAQQ